MFSVIVRSMLGTITAIAVITASARSGVQAASPTASETPPTYQFKDVVIGMERTSCFGQCPVYSVEIRGDGSGSYRGQRHVSDPGPHTVHLERAQVIRLLTAFFNARFFESRDRYDDFATVEPRGDDKFEVIMSTETDLPTTVLHLQLAGRTKTIVLRENYPVELGELAKAIDEVTGSAAWVIAPSK